MLPIAVFVAAAAALLVANYCLQWYNRRWNTTPRVPEFPILGNIPNLLWRWNDLHEWLTELALKYEDKFSFWVPGQGTFICCLKPEDIKHFLQGNFENYGKGLEFHTVFKPLLGDGIFSTDGETWKTQRKTASRIFNVANFKNNMCEVFADRAQVFCDVISSKMSSAQESVVDMGDMFHKYTLESFGTIAFGTSLGCLESDKVPFAVAFDETQETLNQRFFTPMWRWTKWFKPDEWRLRSNQKILDDFATGVIRSRRDDPALNERNDLLSLFMADGIMQRYTTQEEQDTFLRDVVMNFIIAGRDTTAQALSWTFYELSQHPDVEETLVKEIQTVCKGRAPTYEDLKKLKFLQAVLQETLRLHPSVPKDGKIAFNDDVLPDGTVIKKDTWMVFLPYAMGRMKSLWGEDAGAFRPDRWFEKNDNASGPSDDYSDRQLVNESPFKFTAFQAGPRICLGQNMAYIEAKLVTSVLLQRFKFRLVPGQTVTYRNTITLPMKHGMRMVATPRM